MNFLNNSRKPAGMTDEEWEALNSGELASSDQDGPMTDEDLTNWIVSQQAQPEQSANALAPNTGPFNNPDVSLAPDPKTSQNFFVNNATGAKQTFESAPVANAATNQAMPDYASPIEIAGVGKGFRIKGDPSGILLADGRIAHIGVDVEGQRKQQMADLAMQKAKQSLQIGDAQIAALQAKANGKSEDGNLDPANLPDGVKEQVQALIEGRMAFPSGMALRTPYWQKMLQLVAAQDPTFDAVNYNARSKTRSDFSSGKSAQAITAFNTVLGHMENLKDAGDALKNSDSPVWNAAANKASEWTGDPRIRNYNVAKDAVVGELVKAFNNGHITDSQLKEWGSNVTAANSPEQMEAVNKQLVSLLGSKINAMGDQYNNGMGTTKKGIELLSPKAQAVYAKITGEAVPTGGDGRVAAPSATELDAPPPASQYPNKVMTTPGGAKYKSDGKQWVRQ